MINYKNNLQILGILNNFLKMEKIENNLKTIIRIVNEIY